MIYGLIMGVLVYAIAGQVLWQKAIMADISAEALSKLTSEKEMHQHIADRIHHEIGRQTGDPALYIVKASFILLWPLALLYAYVAARLL